MVRQRRFLHFGKARGAVAAGATPRRLGTRSERVAHVDARAGAPAGGRIRFPSFPSGLLSVLAVFASAGPVCYHDAWQASATRTPTGFHYVLIGSRHFDLGFPAPTAAAGRMGADCLPWATGATADAPAGQAGIRRLSRPHCPGEGGRSRDFDCPALWGAVADRGEG